MREIIRGERKEQKVGFFGKEKKQFRCLTVAVRTVRCLTMAANSLLSNCGCSQTLPNCPLKARLLIIFSAYHFLCHLPLSHCQTAQHFPSCFLFHCHFPKIFLVLPSPYLSLSISLRLESLHFFPLE